MRSGWFIWVLLVFGLGCEAQQPDLDVLEEHLRQEPGRGGKVGQVVGLAVRQRARAVAAGPRVDEACALAEGWRRARIVARIEAAGMEATDWVEERTFDAAGGVLTSHIYSGPGDAKISHVWRIQDGHFFSKDLLSEVWFSREASDDDLAQMAVHGLGAGQTVLDAVGGWKKTGEGRWNAGERPLRCEKQSGSESWLDRFSSRVTLLDASLEYTPDRRHIRARWSRSDGKELQVSVEEWNQPDVIPAIGTVVDQKPVVLFDEILGAWEKRGLISR